MKMKMKMEMEMEVEIDLKVIIMIAAQAKIVMWRNLQAVAAVAAIVVAVVVAVVVVVVTAAVSITMRHLKARLAITQNSALPNPYLPPLLSPSPTRHHYSPLPSSLITLLPITLISQIHLPIHKL